METVIQLILTISVVSLTAIFVTVGIWVILILKEFRDLVHRLKRIGEDISETTSFTKEKIKESLNLATVMAAFSAFWSRREEIEKLLLGRSKKKKTRDEFPKKKQLVKKEESDSNLVDKEVPKSFDSENFSSANSTKKSRRFFFRRKK